MIETIRPQHQDELLTRHLHAFLGELDSGVIDELRHCLRWIEVAGGETLMRQGEAGDSLYLLVSGRLRVSIDDATGSHAVREVARGEVVGEMSLFTDAPRSATLVAIRDSVLVRLAKADFDPLIAAHPRLAVALTRQIIRHFQGDGRKRVLERPVTMGLLPVSDGVDAVQFAADLARQLAGQGRVCVLDAAAVRNLLADAGIPMEAGDTARARRQVALLLDQIEGCHDQVLLVADAVPSAWTDCCIRHADEILLLADADAPPALHPTEQALLLDRPQRTEAAEILLLLHPADRLSPRNTADWLARRPLSGHLHLRASTTADMARLARIQSRTAVGLVLAGGGARGLAHLGVYRALCEAGIEVDWVGGTSIGAVMAFYVASDQPLARIDRNARKAFGLNPTGDFNLLPLMSLIKGSRLRRTLQQAVLELVGFDSRLEDLWKGCFCVATNYSRAEEQVLQHGNAVHSMLASISIPGALPPVLLDGDLLSDGGCFNNFPVDVMRRMRGVGTVIGVDLDRKLPRRIDLTVLPGAWALLRDRLRRPARRRYRLPGLATLLINSTLLYSASRRKQAQALTDLYFNPRLDRVGLLDWHRYDEAVEIGYRHAQEVLAAHSAGQAALAGTAPLPGSE